MVSKLKYIRIIASLLTSNNKLVKGQKFENFKSAGSPVTTIAVYESQKIDEIILIDLDSYKNKVKEPNFKLLKKISETSSTPITFGGGIKTFKQVQDAFKSGADKIYLNSVLFQNLDIMKQTIEMYGSQSIVAGLNLKLKNKNYYLLEDTNLIINPFEYAAKLEKLGAGELKFTFVDLEGTKKGIDLVYAKKIKENINIPCIFEGGIGNLNHLKDFFN